MSFMNPRRAPVGHECEIGWSLIETMMALAVTLALLGALYALARPTASLTRSLPATADLQQRLRHAFDRLHADLIAAGQGTAAIDPGPLTRLLPPVMPYRLGRRVDGREHRRARPDAITTVSVSRNAGTETTVLSPITGLGTTVQLAPRPGCAPPACGYRVRDLVLVFDDRRAWELFRVSGTGPMTLALERVHPTATVFTAGAAIAAVELDHYYFDEERLQLRHYDGWGGDFPVVDDLVGLRFRLFGTASPGRSPCSAEVSVEPLGPIDELSLTELTDGPWCGPAGLPFDADLLRVRAVGLELRLQSPVAELRGADPRLFARPGLALGGASVVPDYGISFIVAPRNLSSQLTSRAGG